MMTIEIDFRGHSIDPMLNNLKKLHDIPIYPMLLQFKEIFNFASKFEDKPRIPGCVSHKIIRSNNTLFKF